MSHITSLSPDLLLEESGNNLLPHTILDFKMASQHLQTPVRGRRAELLSTPSTGGQLTPSPSFNPFESNYEHLQHAVVTPGVFREKVEETPDKPFQWDIEHVARLDPVDFGDITERLKRQDRHCRKIDHVAQDAVQKFFKNEHILPSPWSEPVQKTNLLSIIKEEEKSQSSESKRHASSQTDVHIPLSVDFNEIFKHYRLSDSQIEDLNRGESFSNSSLRRKLFNNESECSMSDSLERIPVMKADSPRSPGRDDWCSSSPVFLAQHSDPDYSRRCSVTAGLRYNSCSREASPDLSPITSPIKASSSSLIKLSPDLQEGLARMKTKFDFDAKDEFGCEMQELPEPSCSSSFEEHDSRTDHPMSSRYSGQERCDDSQSSDHFHDDEFDAQEMNRQHYPHREVNGGEIPAATNTLLGTSDTGYQTCSLASLQTFSDLSSARDTRTCAGPATPPKPDRPDWEPPVASTPNKQQHVFL